MTLLAFSSSRCRCGIRDYVAQVYPNAECFGKAHTVKIFDLNAWNCIKAPFLGADIVHLQHEYSLLGPAGIMGIVLLLYWWIVLRARLVVTLHTVYEWSQSESIFAHRLRFRPLLRALKHYGLLYNRLILACADLVVLLSPNSLRTFRMEAPPHASTCVIPIGAYDVPAPPLNGSLSSLGISDRDFVLTLFGFAHPNKGFHLAMEAVQKLSDLRVKLLVVGGSSDAARGYQTELQRLALTLGLGDRVIFTGYLEADDPLFAQCQSRTDCFVYPYLRESAASASLARTLATRKLCLVSDLEMFRNFPAGLKFRANDVGDLCAAVRRAINMTPNQLATYRKTLGDFVSGNNISAARNSYLNHFNRLTKTHDHHESCSHHYRGSLTRVDHSCAPQ